MALVCSFAPSGAVVPGIPPREAKSSDGDQAHCNFEAFPDLYKRIRINYIEEMRKKQPTEFDKRLANFVGQTALNKMFGGAEATGI